MISHTEIEMSPVLGSQCKIVWEKSIHESKISYNIKYTKEKKCKARQKLYSVFMELFSVSYGIVMLQVFITALLFSF